MARLSADRPAGPPVTATLAPAHALDAPARRAPFASPLLAFALGLLLFAATQRAGALAVWASGAFSDTDDALRMVELREWLAGKPWFDASVSRMGGFRLHWSHVVDLPLAALLGLFGAFLDPAHAERAARLAFPLLCFAATLAALIAAGRRLAGPAGGLVAALLAPTSLFAVQFRAGRIDHHGPQILLLILVVATSLAALDPRRARAGALAGLFCALSLAISVENLPFLAAAAAVFGFAAALDPRHGAASARFGLAFALATGAAWAIFADRAAGSVCDAISTFHVAAAGLGGLGLALFGFAAPRLPPLARAALLGTLGGATLAMAKLAFPHCLADPLADLPPVMVEHWLSQVREARPLAALWTHDKALVLAIAGPLIAALATSLFAARRALSGAADGDPATARARWLALFVFLAAGAAATLWQVRASTSTFALLPLAGAAAVALVLPLARRGRLALLAPVAAGLVFSPLLWAALGPPSTAPDQPDTLSCLTPQALAGVAALPPGLVLTSIDPGSFLLAHTPHRALAGAYHRNVAGNVAALDALLAPADAGVAAARRIGVAYVATCDALADMAGFAAARPGSLAAALAADQPPQGLERIAVEGPWRVYRPR